MSETAFSKPMAAIGRILAIGLVLAALGCGTGGLQDNGSADEREPQTDLDAASARPLTAGTVQQGYIEYVGDADWYRLEIPAGVDILRIELSNQTLSSPVDLSFTLYAEDGVTILGGRYDLDGSDGMTQITQELATDGPGLCFVVVRDHGGDDADPLNLYFLKAALSAGAGDGNNSPESAVTASCGDALEDSIQVRGDVDWFRIDRTAGADILALSLATPAGTPDLALTLYDSAATTALVSFADGDGTDGPTLLTRNVRLAAAGPYFLSVRDTLDDDADPRLSYILRTDCFPDPDPYEPNGNFPTLDENRGHAWPLSAGAAAEGFIAFQGDEDWFRLAMPGQGLMNLSVAVQGGSQPLQLVCTLLGPDGRTVEAEFEVRAGREDTAYEARFALSQGVHYLRIRDAGDDGADPEVPYEIVWSFEPDPDSNEPNGNFATRRENLNHATFLSVGGLQEGYIGSTADQDWFQVFVERPGVYNFALSNGSASDVDLTLSLYQPDGETLLLTRQDDDSRGEDGPTRIETQLYLFQAGTYYLLVQDLGNDNTDLSIPYRVEARAVTLPVGSTEPDEDRSQAQLVLPGQTVTGWIEFEGDRDWYSLLIVGNQDVIVEIWNDAPSPVEFIWFMYPPSSTQVYASAGDDTEGDENLIHLVTGDDETFWVDADHSGLYVFKVSDYNRNDWDTLVPYHFRVTLWPHGP